MSVGGNPLRRRLLSMTLMVLLLGVIVPMQVGLVRAEVFTDPIGDLFDRQGKPVAAEPYLDIVEVELTRSGTEYNARIKVNGPLPSSLSDPAIVLKWDLLVDIDQDWETQPWFWPLLDNGIGVDLLIQLTLGPSGQSYTAAVLNVATGKGVRISFNVEGATIQLKFDDSSLGTIPKAFDLVFVARKFGNYGQASGELAIDKAPNRGYFTFSDGKTSLTPEFTVKQPYQGPMTDAHVNPATTKASRMMEIMDVLRQAGYNKAIFMSYEGALAAYAQRPNEIIPSFYVAYMNRTSSVREVENALQRGFMWVGEAPLRHRRGTGTTPADYPTALQIYDLCAKYQVPIIIHQDSTDYKDAYKELERAFALSPQCIFIFHGGAFGSSELTMADMERILQTYPNVYIQIAGVLERPTSFTSTGFVVTQEFAGGTAGDPFAYTVGRICKEWRDFFVKYPERIINGNDFTTESVFTVEQVKIRIDYFRKLFGQIDQKAAEMINYKNVEDLLAKRICLMNVSLSSESIKVGDMLTVTARLRNMGASPISNETVAFFLESSDGKTIALGETKTDKTGFAVLNCAVNTVGGSYWIVASHPESGSYAYRSARNKLTVSQPVTTASVSTISTITTESQKKCIIATVVYGSELTPEVQFLRDFRDSIVMSTQSGRAFMNVFNKWYYSFSPQVASALSENRLLRNMVRTSLYPLIGALSTSASIQSALASNPELATITAGLVASALMGLVYIFPPMLLISTLVPWCLRSRRKN